MIIQWLGQSAFALYYKENLVLIDPWIRNNPVCPKTVEEYYNVNTILVTHGHFDHFGDSIELMQKSNAKLVCDPEISWYMNSKGFTRGERLFPVAQGGAIQLNGLKVTMVPAIHPSAIYGEEWHSEKRWFANSSAAGYVIEAEGEPTVYHAGDTALFSDMSLIAKRYKPQVGLLPIGGRFTMDAVDAIEAINFMGFHHVIPMHYNTNPDLKADVATFKSNVENRFDNTKVFVMEPGSEIAMNL